MSNAYKKIEYVCDCGQDYGSCEKTGAFMIKYMGVSDLNELFLKSHPSDKVVSLGIFTDKQIEALGKLLTSQWDDLAGLSEIEVKEINEVP